jgi:hypothetical protein
MQSFTPVPGSTLHLGGVGKNRIGKEQSTQAAGAATPATAVVTGTLHLGQQGGTNEVLTTFLGVDFERSDFVLACVGLAGEPGVCGG